MSHKIKNLKLFCFIAVVFAASLPTQAADEPGFVSLFNGKDLSGWDGNPKFWSVKDGVIDGTTTKDNPTKGNTFLIYRNDSVDDFELRLDYQLIGGNSGIQYRSKEVSKWVVSGYQADMASNDVYSGIMYHEKGRGILAQRGTVSKIVPKPGNPKAHQVKVIGSVGKSEDIQALINKDGWNQYTIIANGNQLTHIINGRVTSITIDEHPAGSSKSGILALQLHAGPPMTLQVKNIRIRKIK